MAVKIPFGSTFGGQLVTGAANSLFGGLFNLASQRRAYEYNQKLMAQQNQYEQAAADQAYRRQLEFYERQLNDDRTYNDPSAVKQRYLDAGLNPYSAFGTAGSYRPLQAPSLSGVQPADVASAPYMDPGQTVFGDPLEAAYKVAVIRNINAQATKTENETPTEDMFRRSYESSIQLREQEIINKRTQNQIDELTRQFEEATISARISASFEEWNLLVARTRFVNQQVTESASRQRLNEKSVDLVETQINLNNANLFVAFTSALLNLAGIELTKAQIANLQAQTQTTNELRSHLVRFNKFMADQAEDKASVESLNARIAKLQEQAIDDRPGMAARFAETKFMLDMIDASLVDFYKLDLETQKIIAEQTAQAIGAIGAIATALVPK